MQHNSILVTELADHLNVSSVTIRKDLTDLEKEKKLYRNHGKAILINPYINDRNVNEKEKFYIEEKRLIGMQAASMITKKDSILIASGTTMHALARCIQTTDKLTVITASLSWEESYGIVVCRLLASMPKLHFPTFRAVNCLSG